ncbi:MAG TPA: M56 family metallopeptidase, partial [Clostridia bacterium]|nr:M56 family metallopeptidase [Clostridia bacterium]
MEALFLGVINMSITGSYVILFLIVARQFIKKAPKSFSYALWSVALIRLICPFTLESIISIIPVNVKSVSADMLYSTNPKINIGIGAIDNAVNAYLPSGTPYASVNPMQAWIFIGETIWIVGIAAIIIYSLISLIGLRKRLKNAANESGNIYTSESIDTPLVLGVFRPRIYLPAAIRGEEREYILIH